MPITNVRFSLTINSGNDDVVANPKAAILAILGVVTQRLDALLIHDSEIIPLRDGNGNRIGEVWAEIEEEIDDEDL